jgi:uncharacterized protein (UPF0276 family)
MNRDVKKVSGAGLGVQRILVESLLNADPGGFDFIEVAPENWIGVGGRYRKQFRELAERHPVILHGLSLDLGGTDPLDTDLVSAVQVLMAELGAPIYSEHLTYCATQGQLYELLPLPFTEEAVRHVSARIMQVQDMLGQPLVVENASYYAQFASDMNEAEFISAVARESGCELLLDVNNVYVNSCNHGYDALQFIDALPLDRVRYLHMAGHSDMADGLKLDTHGSEVIEPVWELLSEVYSRIGCVPTVIERDTNIPPLPELLAELAYVRELQGSAQQSAAVGGDLNHG